MATLNWIGKEKVVNYHQNVISKSIEKKYTFNSDSSENMIIHGDNLIALKSLLPKYEGSIDCIYIDPPYNTGTKEGKWVYNDNVSDPRIAKWIGEVVGPEGEDLSRHDKWLCMMYPRLKLLQKLLSPDGRIFISIDENELYSLKLICDEIFGNSNFCGQYMWYKSATPPNLSYKVKRNLEYILCYEKNKTSYKFTGVQKSSPSDDPMTKPQNSFKVLCFKAGTINFKGKDGIYKAGIYGTSKYPNKLLNDMIIKNGKNVNDVMFENRFIWVQRTLDNNIKDNVTINLSKNLVLSYKRDSYSAEVPPNLIDMSVGVNTTEEAGKLLEKIFGENPFTYPKDVSLIEYLLQFVNKKDAIILDCFAGSGTTAHAVLNLNNNDNGNRKFILCEMMDYAESITSERIKKVILGYQDVKGTGGDFSFYELGESIFNEDGIINPNINLIDLKRYIYYTETQQELVNEDNPFLGEYNNTSYYLFYDKDTSYCLNTKLLGEIKNKSEWYVIYADTCLLSEEFMKKYSIIFKKLPRDIIKY